MASGSISKFFKSGNSGGWKLQMDWISTKDEANNRSSITAKLYLVSIGTGYTIGSGMTNTCSITINGVSSTDTFNPSISSNQKKLINTYTAWVGHNSDGKKNINLSAWADVKVTLSGEYIGRATIPNNTITLDNIARRSTFTVDKTSIKTADTLKFIVSPASPNFTHDLEIKVFNQVIKKFTDVANTQSYTANQSERDLIYAQEMFKKEVPVKFILYTYSNGVLLGNQTREGKYLLTEYPPLFSDFTFKDINSTTISITGNNQRLIQNESDLEINISKASGQKYATVKEYEVTVAKKTKKLQQEYYLPALNMGKINGSGNTLIKVTAIDSRGMRTDLNKIIEFIPYLPHSQNARVSRFGGYGEETTIEVRGKFSPLMVGGVQKNTIISAQYRYYKFGESAPGWTDVYYPIFTGEDFKYPKIAINLDDETRFTVEVRTKDNISNAYQYEEFDIRKGVAPFQLDIGTGDLRQQGAIIFTGGNSVVNSEGNINHYQGATGTAAGLRALRMGETSYISGSNVWPTWAGNYAFFQGAKKGGAGGPESDRFGDFFLWKDRTAKNRELYLGNSEGTSISNVDLIDTVLEKVIDGDNGSYIRYSSGIQICWRSITLDTNSQLNQTYSFEAPFIESPLMIDLKPPISTASANYITAVTSILKTSGTYGWTFKVGSPRADGNGKTSIASAIGRWK